DWGPYAVPHLIEVMNRAHAADDEAVQKVAVNMLRLAARRPLIDPFNPNPSDELKAVNRAIDLDNAWIRNLTYSAGASQEERERVVQQWNDWYQKNETRFTLSATQ